MKAQYTADSKYETLVGVLHNYLLAERHLSLALRKNPFCGGSASDRLVLIDKLLDLIETTSGFYGDDDAQGTTVGEGRRTPTQ